MKKLMALIVVGILGVGLVAFAEAGKSGQQEKVAAEVSEKASEASVKLNEAKEEASKKLESLE